MTSQNVEFVRKGDQKTLDTLYKARQVSEKDVGDWIQARYLMNMMEQVGFLS